MNNEKRECALVKVGAQGVLHEKIAYFSRLPD